MKGVVQENLTKHCWVVLDDGQCEESRLRKKFLREKMECIVDETKVIAKVVGGDDGNAAKAVDNLAEAQLKSEENKWLACGAVFC